METWIIYAVLSALFAGMTSVLAKFGMDKLQADQALFIRILTIFIVLNGMLLAGQRHTGFKDIAPKDLMLLIASGLTTSLSWIFYYRAMKEGTVSHVASIDKLSIVITLALSFLLLKEPLTAKTAAGSLLIVAGIAIMLI